MGPHIRRKLVDTLGDDPAVWARQCRTLNTLQAYTTEVCCDSEPGPDAPDGSGRGVRWLRDVLHRRPPVREGLPQSRTVDLASAPTPRGPAGLQRRGIVLGGGGEGAWRAAAHGMEEVPRPLIRTVSVAVLSRRDMDTPGDFGRQLS
eukprot:EG_transcript_41690